MANTLPTTMEYFDNLLGEQLTEGGGGESDFSKVNVTLEVSRDKYFENYSIYFVDKNQNAVAMMVETMEGPGGEYRGFNTDGFDVEVNHNSPITKEIYLFQNNYVSVFATSANELEDFTVTGDAEADSYEEDGVTYYFVKVYGDCTISTPGTK